MKLLILLNELSASLEGLSFKSFADNREIHVFTTQKIIGSIYVRRAGDLTFYNIMRNTSIGDKYILTKYVAMNDEELVAILTYLYQKND